MGGVYFNHVLIIDDDSIILMSLSAALKKMGVEKIQT